MRHGPRAASCIGFLMTDTSRTGRLKLRTSALRAYTMLMALIVIWLFFQWANIDLSIGAVVGLAGGVAALTQGYGLVPALLSAILVGLIIGALQGTLVA